MTLAALLFDHPFARRRAAAALGGRRRSRRERPRRRADGRADAARRGSRAGPGRCGPAPERPGRDRRDVRGLAGGRGVRPDQPAFAGSSSGARSSKRRARRRCSPEASPSCSTGPKAYDADVAFVTWTSGTTGAPKPVLHTHANYLELLDRVLAPLRGIGRRTRRRARPDAEPRAGVAGAQRRHLQRVVRTPGRRGDRRHGRVRAARVRGARRTFRDPLDRAPARGDGDVVGRRRRHRPHAAALRAQHHRAAVAVAGAPLRREVRRRRAERLRAGRDR